MEGPVTFTDSSLIGPEIRIGRAVIGDDVPIRKRGKCTKLTAKHFQPRSRWSYRRGKYRDLHKGGPVNNKNKPKDDS